MAGTLYIVQWTV